MSLHRWNGRHASAGLGLATTLLLALSGCGDKGGATDEGVTLPTEPLAAPTKGDTLLPLPAGSTDAATTPAASTPAVASPAAGGAEGWGTLKGRVVFNGDAPEPKAILATKDLEVCATEPHKSERLVVDPATKGVKFAIVYIPKPTKVSPEARSAVQRAVVEFDQKQCVFRPHVLAAMKGEKIVLKSSDSVTHNIDAHLKTNSIFNQSISPGGKSDLNLAAGERSPVDVFCSIHPWMHAYWLILDNPYFAVTDEKGNFEIKNVPAGSQKVVVWQEAVAYVTPSSGEAIAIKPDGTTEQEFKIDPAKVKAE